VKKNTATIKQHGAGLVDSSRLACAADIASIVVHPLCMQSSLPAQATTEPVSTLGNHSCRAGVQRIVIAVPARSSGTHYTETGAGACMHTPAHKVQQRFRWGHTCVSARAWSTSVFASAVSPLIAQPMCSSISATFSMLLGSCKVVTPARCC
jgi:hypothetical protein